MERNIAQHKKGTRLNATGSEKSVKKSLVNGRLACWWAQIQRFSILLPHLTPARDTIFWVRITGIVACLIITRGLKVLMPVELGRIVTLLDESRGQKLWPRVLKYSLFRVLMSSAGINTLKEFLWQPLADSAMERLNTATFKHIISLSSDFHDDKKSTLVWQRLHRSRSVVHLLNTLSFEVLPQISDLVLAIGVFWNSFGGHVATIACISITLYFWTSVRFVSKRTGYQRRSSNVREQEQYLVTQTSLNWISVAHFDRFRHETSRYAEAVHSTQRSSWDHQIVNVTSSALRELAMLLGLAAASLLISLQIQSGERNVADFVMLVSYWSQLTSPLSAFASTFMRVTQVMVEAENLVEIFYMQPSVKERRDAVDLMITQGLVEFEGVGFSYVPERQVLDDINFNIRSGQVVALVGETGGGKSSVLKLLMRMHDTSTGSIKIDDQDLKDVTISSLRRQIGIVPQSIGLFNTSILENVRYGRLDASFDECQNACKAAAIHERILTFPDGYATMVGERGVKLSGGELQRVGLARVLLKDPKIILLDEATSSVDGLTETKIQKTLKRWTVGRTTFIVAHRLSTIAHADLILVIKEGRIIERGSHTTLLFQNGHYYRLWMKQVLSAPIGRPPPTRSQSWNSLRAQVGSTPI